MPALDENILAALQRSYALDEREDWPILLHRLELGRDFAFHTILAPDAYGVEIARRALAGWFAARKAGQLHTLSLKESDPPETLAVTLLQPPPPGTAAIWVQTDGPDPTSDPTAFIEKVWTPAIAILNARRNTLQRDLPLPLLLAGPFHLQTVLREHAPDLWSIRHSVTYLDPPGPRQPLAASPQFSAPPAPGGDPDFTLSEAAKLAGLPGQELAYARYLHRAGVQLGRAGRWAEAEKTLLRCLDLRRTHHAPPDETGETLNALGILFHRTGHDHRAEFYFRQAYELAELTYGPEHPNTLSSRNNLANALDDQGKHAEAEAEHRAVLTSRERVLGPEHPDTLASRNNLAVALRAQGKNAEAEREHRAILALRQRVLGPEHPETLASRNNLALALSDQGQHAEAKAEDRARIAIEERILGPEHPDTMTSRNNLAFTLYVQGQHAEAEKEHRTVLATRERVLGPEHPDIFQSCFNLALCLWAEGEKAEALLFARRASEGWRKSLGEEHPYTKQAKELLERLKQAQ